MERKFKVICLECGSENVTLDMDWDEEILGYEFKCKNCNAFQNIEDSVDREK